MSDSLAQILVIAIPALFASQGLWSIILYKIQRKSEKEDLRTKADLVILHDLIYRYCEKAILKGWTTFDEFDNLTSLYEVYREIGGNGTAQKLFEEYCQLPKHSGVLKEQDVHFKEKK